MAAEIGFGCSVSVLSPASTCGAASRSSDNAITALRGQGQIEIRLRYRNTADRVQIIVSDNGPGISDEDKSLLFEPDFSTKKTGMGLGLTIVNTIVAEHDGKIRVEDRDPHGARFSISLPIERKAGA